MYQLKFRRSNNQIELVISQGIKGSLMNCIISKPKLSLKGLRAIYLALFEWLSI